MARGMGYADAFQYGVGRQLYRGKNVKQEVLLITGQVHRSRAMQNTSDNADRELESAGKHPLDGATPRPLGSRTAAAGSEFLKALGSDLAGVAVRPVEFLTVIRHRLAEASKPAIAAMSALAARLVELLTVLLRERLAEASKPAIAAMSALVVQLGQFQTVKREPREPPAALVVPAMSARGMLLRRLGLGIALTALSGTLTLSCAMLWALHDAPLDKRVFESNRPTLLLEAANGEPLGRAGPLKLADDRLQDFPAILIQAVLSTEDRRFYDHFGVDPLGILRAAHANRVAGGIVEGGSTITQQLVKLEYRDNRRTYTRKLREALLAIWLETHLSKDEILIRYLNRVYVGDGAYGVATTAQLYFGKRPADLTLAEAAMLAGLIQAPSEFDPLRHIEAAQARAAAVLDAMVANGVIDEKTATAAKASPATVRSSPQLMPASSWFTDWIAKRAAGLTSLQTGSARVRTTLMPGLQRLAQQVLDDALTVQGRRLGVSQGALVAMRPDGAVVAMVGGRDYQTSQFNRAADANRQPGSAFKLFVYLAALRNGYTPQDTIDAGPVDINGWKPENFDNEGFGRITLAEAFARSVNTAAVRLAMNVGLDHVIAAARDLGIDAAISPVPSSALGAVGVSLLDLTSAFASVRSDRMHIEAWGVAAVGPADRSQMWTARRPLISARTLDPYQKPLVDLLQGVIEYGTGRAAALGGVFAAGKTGTSQDYRDAWFIRFNDALVVGVWVGNDDDAPMKRVVGGTLPAAIWKRFMTEATPLIDQPGISVAKQPANPTQLPDVLTSKSDDQAVPDASQRPDSGFCDYQACSSFYHSFRASDCTYQPYSGGPRQLCEKGKLPSNEAAQTFGIPPDGPAPVRCNIDVCARFYMSFNSSDCTYQPYGGPRQLCEK